jgi:hypothetical protein
VENFLLFGKKVCVQAQKTKKQSLTIVAFADGTSLQKPIPSAYYAALPQHLESCAAGKERSQATTAERTFVLRAEMKESRVMSLDKRSKTDGTEVPKLPLYSLAHFRALQKYSVRLVATSESNTLMPLAQSAALEAVEPQKDDCGQM